MKWIEAQRFPLGRVVATTEALNALKEADTFGFFYIRRHAAGDWGDLSQADKDENELSLKEGFRLLSAYKLPVTGEKLWVITEADRSATTLLLPSEY